MRKEYEFIHHSKMKHLNAFVINITYRNFHMHSDFELLLILEGTCRIHLKNDNFAVKSGDSVLINPNEMHEIESRDEGLKLIILQFSRHLINDYFPLLRSTYFRAHAVKDHFKPEEYMHFVQAVKNLTIKYIEGRELFALDCLHLSTDILTSLYRNLPYELLNENAYRERKKRSDRVSRISSYIDENYLYPIRLQDIAEQEGISITHLSHFFTDNFGTTFQEYLNDKRLEQALQLAGTKKYSLSELSELSGFSDPKYLNKAFLRKFGYPFQEYKNSVRQLVGKPTHHPSALQYYYSDEESLRIINNCIKVQSILK